MAKTGKHGMVRKSPFRIVIGVIAVLAIAAAIAHVSFYVTYGPSLDRIAVQDQDALGEDFIYDRAAAIAYAKSHTENTVGMTSAIEFVASKLGYGREPGFPNYGFNCANFVSQCLLAGGIPESMGWHAWNSDGEWDVSESWRLAHAQYEFFSNPDNGFINGAVIDTHFTSFDSPEGMIDIPLGSLASEAYKLGIQEGDLICFHDQNGYVMHIAMVSSVSQSGVFYTANSTPQFQASVYAAMIRYQNAYGAYIVRLKDSSIEIIEEVEEEEFVDAPEPSNAETETVHANEFGTKVQGWVL